MDRDLEELSELAGQMQAMVEGMGAAQAAMRVETEAADPRGAVTVVLDPSGRLSAARPSAQWADRVEPEELGAAVLEAIQLGQGERLARWAEAAQAPSQSPSQSTPAPPSPPVAAPAPDFDLRQLTEEATSMLEAVERLQAGASAEESAPEPDGHHDPVEVTLSRSGEPTVVWIDPGWARSVSRNELAGRLRQAFEDAYTAYDAGGGTAAAPPLPEMSPQMAALAANPAGVLLGYVENLRTTLGTDGEEDR